MPFENLLEAFEAWANFGQSRSSMGSKGSLNALNSTSGSTLDNARFAKLCKETGIVDGKVITTTEVDLVFNKVRAASQRRLTFEEFTRALDLLSEKKYPGGSKQSDRMQAIVTLIRESDGPLAKTNVGPTSDAATSVVNRLTDTSNYTGTHRERFNVDGTGKGRDGRDTSNGIGKASNRAYKGMSQDVTPPGRKSLPSSTERLASNEGLASLPKKTEAKSTEKLAGGSKSNLSGSKGSVFDRLTDVEGYTGSHKNRFNADGTGRGLAGRDSTSKGTGSQTVYHGGDVKDLAQILRK